MKLLKVGKIVNSHGIKGEIKIYPYTNDVLNLSNIKYFYLENNDKLIVLSKKIIKNMIVFKIEGYDNINDIKPLINNYIYIEKEEIEDEDTYYIEDLIGLDVYENNLCIGKINYIYQNGPDDVYEVEKKDKSKIYIPAIKEFVLNIDIKNNKIDVKIIEGLDL